MYIYINIIVVGGIVGVGSTVWFMVGGIIDIREYNYVDKFIFSRLIVIT